MTPPGYEYQGPIYRHDAELAKWLAQQAPETALEPDLPIIDAHHHLWDTPRRGRYLLPELLADLACGHNVIGTVYVECGMAYGTDAAVERRPLGEVRFAREVAERHAASGGPTSVGAGIVGHADLTVGACVAGVLEAALVEGAGRLCGIRHTTPWHDDERVYRYLSRYVPPQQLLDARFREGFAQLAPLGLSFDAWVLHPQLPDLLDLARAFPDTTIVLDHLGSALGVGPYEGRRTEVFDAWRRDVLALARCPNVHVKLGGLGMTHFGFGFHLREVPPTSLELAEAWRPYLETCIEAFGVHRCMFESNFPPDRQSSGYGVLWNAFKRITAPASADEKAALYCGTAARVYRLTRAPDG